MEYESLEICFRDYWPLGEAFWSHAFCFSTRKVEKYLIDTYISPDIQSGIDYVKGWDSSVNPTNRNEIGGTLEKCRLYAIKMGYKMWGHRTEKHDDNLKNICFF